MNEMLTWMQSHPLPFACTTDFAEALDPASLRRFVFKVKVDYLGSAQAEQAFRVFFDLELPTKLAGMRIFTPGDSRGGSPQGRNRRPSGRRGRACGDASKGVRRQAGAERQGRVPRTGGRRKRGRSPLTDNFGLRGRSATKGVAGLRTGRGAARALRAGMRCRRIRIITRRRGVPRSVQEGKHGDVRFR